MAHRIERAASGRSRCRSCKKSIANGSLRLAEEFLGEYSREATFRFHHLECAADEHPYVLSPALNECEIDVPGRDELEARIARALSVSDAAQADDATAAEYARFVALMTADPDDVAAPQVFADWLQSVADPRGELIVVQRAIEGASGEQRVELTGRERQLLDANRRTFIPESLDGKIEWKGGFVDRLSLHAGSALVLERLARLWQHPSMLLLRELVVDLSRSPSGALIVPNLGPLPSTVRRLSIRQAHGEVAGSVAGLAGAPLTSLALDGFFDVEAIVLPMLEELELTTYDFTVLRRHQAGVKKTRLASRLGMLAPAQLPALRRLTLACKSGCDAAVNAIAKSGLLGVIDELVLSADLSDRGVKKLERHRASKPLAVIDVSRNAALSRDSWRALEGIADRVVLPDAKSLREELRDDDAVDPLAEWRVRHVRRPEWGIGVVIDETDEGIEIDFEHAGRKMIRARLLIEDV